MPRLKKYFRTKFKQEKELWAISAIALIWVAIFAYYPMYGMIYAFFDYFPGLPFEDWQFVGLKHFMNFFRMSDFPLIMRNTLAISALGLTIGFVAPIVLALLFNELHMSGAKRFFQSVSYLPHFVSWVVVASLVFSMLGSDGVVNNILMELGFIDSPIGFITEGRYFWGMLTALNIWKGVGYGSIIYISAISGIDQELYQAGAVDGLGRLGMAWHITLPSILPTIVLLFILGTGNILNAGFEQQLLIGTAQTRDYYEVIDTYVYRYGIQLGNYSFSIAVGLLKSIIGMCLVFMTNFIAKKSTGMAIF